MVSGVTRQYWRRAQGSSPDERGEYATISPVQSGLGVGSAQHGNLVAQDESSAFFDSRRYSATELLTAGVDLPGTSQLHSVNATEPLASVSRCSFQGGEQHEHDGDHGEQAVRGDDGDRQVPLSRFRLR